MLLVAWPLSHEPRSHRVPAPPPIIRHHLRALKHNPLRPLCKLVLRVRQAPQTCTACADATACTVRAGKRYIDHTAGRGVPAPLAQTLERTAVHVPADSVLQYNPLAVHHTRACGHGEEMMCFLAITWRSCALCEL